MIKIFDETHSFSLICRSLLLDEIDCLEWLIIVDDTGLLVGVMSSTSLVKLLWDGPRHEFSSC